MPIKVQSLRIRQVDRMIKLRAHKGMQQGAAIVADHMRFEVSTKFIPYQPSAPGSPPHRKTDELFNSIFWDYDAVTFTAIIGTTSMHGYYTEFGPLYDPRPWARPSFLDTMTSVAWAIARSF